MEIKKRIFCDWLTRRRTVPHAAARGNFCEKERKSNLYTNAPMVELVYLVSDANENKEVLWVHKKGFSEVPRLHCPPPLYGAGYLKTAAKIRKNRLFFLPKRDLSKKAEPKLRSAAHHPEVQIQHKKVEEFISAPPRVCPLDLAYKLLHSSKK